jgi:two-component system, NarL family, sensor histidine kinase UhpB
MTSDGEQEAAWRNKRLRRGRGFLSSMRAQLRFGWRSLAARTFLAGAIVLALVFVLLLVTPVEVSAPIKAGQAAILFGGLVAMLAIQLLLLRRALAPLRRLSSQMESIDLRQPMRRLTVTGTEAAEITAFVTKFNEMLERLADERFQRARAALGGQEAERLRTARELHDEIGQALTAVALQVERMAAEDVPATPERLDEVARRLKESLDDIRRIVRELRPEALDDLGLVNALIALTSRIARQTEIAVVRRLSGELPPLSAEQELVIYRIAQESLTNVVRHAEASTAWIVLKADDGLVTLTVSDDGRGIERGGEEIGSGIEGMRERAMLVGASLEIDSRPTEGTRIRLVVPAGRGGS